MAFIGKGAILSSDCVTQSNRTTVACGDGTNDNWAVISTTLQPQITLKSSTSEVLIEGSIMGLMSANNDIPFIRVESSYDGGSSWNSEYSTGNTDRTCLNSNRAGAGNGTCPRGFGAIPGGTAWLNGDGQGNFTFSYMWDAPVNAGSTVRVRFLVSARQGNTFVLNGGSNNGADALAGISYVNLYEIERP